MLDVSSLSLSSSLSSEPSASESIPALPPPFPNLVVASAMVVTRSELLAISEVSEPDMTWYTTEPEEIGPHAGTSTSML
jgi:hypothetical protein